jgi:glycosyltransferase involved in cell wall biosynthesis
MQILYTAAHAHFPDTEPLGGGKAVADYLCRGQPNWTLLSPKSLGLLSDGGPRSVVATSKEWTRQSASLHHLADLTELQYARFCRQFERAATTEILRHNPADYIVLANDISEGPDFRALGERGYRIATIWHVDVVEYFTKFYLRELVRPETAANWSRFKHMPDVLKLVFHKQADCVRHSRLHIVPSEPMRDMILRCYPDCPREKIAVLPWGNLAVGHASRLSTSSTDKRDACPTISDNDFVIMTLSRLSPEKGIERLLAALPHVTGNVRVWICGAPAYMKGKRYEKKLRRMADGRVEFLGHVTGNRKAALLHRADLFVSPSRHESYGLTIAEAEAAGCRILSHHHYGAKGRVVNCDDPRTIADAIDAMLREGRVPKTLTTAPSDTAERMAALLANL